MKEEKRLDRKIKRLFQRAGHPRWIHRIGPKKFETISFRIDTLKIPPLFEWWFTA